MAFGFRVANESTDLLIDENYHNYVIMTRGTARRGQVNYTGSQDGSNLFFIHPLLAGSQNYFFSYGSTAGGLLTGENFWYPEPGSYAIVDGNGPGHGTQASFEYLTTSNLNVYPDPGNNSFAAVVYDQNGRKTFDSRYPYFKVVGVYYLQRGAIGTPAYGYADITLPNPPSGKKYFFLLNHLTMIRSDITSYGSSGDEDTYGGAIARISNTQFRIFYEAWHEYSEFAGSARSRWIASSHVMCMMVVMA